jgi:hypothetical protein
MNSPVPVSELGNLVRGWMHSSKQLTEINRQAASARNTRDKYETAIISLLQANKQENAILQTNEGRIHIGQERHSKPLTMKYLDEILHMYYTSKPSIVKDETDDIMKFIRANRVVEETKRLKLQ